MVVTGNFSFCDLFTDCPLFWFFFFPTKTYIYLGYPEIAGTLFSLLFVHRYIAAVFS